MPRVTDQHAFVTICPPAPVLVRSAPPGTRRRHVGFMDKLKGTAKQAVNPRGQMADRDKITRS